MFTPTVLGEMIQVDELYFSNGLKPTTPPTRQALFKGILAAPPKATPPSNKRLIRPYFLGGVALGGVARIPMNYFMLHVIKHQGFGVQEACSATGRVSDLCLDPCCGTGAGSGALILCLLDVYG